MIRAISVLSGLYWLAPELDDATLIRTVLLVHVCDAVVCFVLASHHDFNKRRWAAAGMMLGIWAVAVLLVRASLSARQAYPRL
ncbi:MAG TPA: hypothetical protein VEB21_09285 [Terriglobales bacterium]|nr:hypothetical protein [Terriglobales bacterium]